METDGYLLLTARADADAEIMRRIIEIGRHYRDGGDRNELARMTHGLAQALGADAVYSRDDVMRVSTALLSRQEADGAPRGGQG